MRRLLALALILIVLWGAACLSAQTLPSADSVLASVIAKHGGASVELASNQRLTGTITYPAGGSRPFTVTVQKRSVRFDTSTRNGPLSVLWQDLRTQQVQDGKRGFADHGSFANSQVNLAPIVALLALKNDPKFSPVVVPGQPGLVGLQFLERDLAGVRPPPFRQPKLIATFWIDTNWVIQGASYIYDTNPVGQVTYQYSYSAALTTPFLQPSGVTLVTAKRSVWTAAVTTAVTNGSISSGFFQITDSASP